MEVIPLEIKLSCTFGTLEEDLSGIKRKDSFNIEVQKLDKNLFLQCYEELQKIQNQLTKGINPYENGSSK